MSRLLIVDDEPAICWGFQEFLSEEGHQVQIASSAEEALKVSAKSPFDAVVLDVRLPGMDGLTALTELRRRTKNAPVIVITAFGSLETAIATLRAGAYDFIAKPLKRAEVVGWLPNEGVMAVAVYPES